MSKEYVEMMIRITDERLLDVEFGSWLHLELTDAKAKYMAQLANFQLGECPRVSARGHDSPLMGTKQKG